MTSEKPSLSHAGFALVATVSLLILLSLIAMGFLSLSAVTLRSSSQDQALLEAQSNARLALHIALGELQKQLGPDQRISANGAILSESAVNHPHWMGVWDSWVAGDPADAPVNEDYPSEASHHPTIGNQPDDSMRPEYARKDQHFRSWLVSLAPEESADPASAQNLTLSGMPMPDSLESSIRLVGTGSLGKTADAADFVSARLVDVTSPTQGKGRYAWWVGDESQKAMIMDDSYETSEQPDSLTDADRIFRLQAPASTGTKAIPELAEINNESKLAFVATTKTLDLIDGVSGNPSQRFHDITTRSYSVIADVREGGLKRDLSVLLERTINENDVFHFSTYEIPNRLGPMTYRQVSSMKPEGDDYMLYRFDDFGRECVPIQDLAAYYQLYDHNPYPWNRGRQEGVAYASEISTNPRINTGIQLSAPDFGNRTAPEKYLRAYTTRYRQPVPIKIQLLLAMKATPIPQNIIDEYRSHGSAMNATHFLNMSIIPSVTMWNPSNLPVVMKGGITAYDPQVIRLSTLPVYIRLKKNGSYSPLATQVTWLNGQGNWYQSFAGGKSLVFTSFLAGTSNVVFEPGEVKVFSFPYSDNFRFQKDNNDNFLAQQELQPGWDPGSFLGMPRTATIYPRNDTSSLHVTPSESTITVGGVVKTMTTLTPVASTKNKLMINASDTIGLEIGTAGYFGQTNDGITGAEVNGAGLQLMCIQKSNQSRLNTGELWQHRNYQILSRLGNNAANVASFNSSLIQMGMPSLVPGFVAASRTGSDIINYADNNGNWPFLQFSMMAACEVGGGSNEGYMSGRRYANRPFLHTTAMARPLIDKSDLASMYNYGWNWWVDEVNDINDAQVQVDAQNRGFYGGGYTMEEGTTHVVQQEIPIAPPLSIAALSHTHLGGYSLATDNPWGQSGSEYQYESITATGSMGLFPHTHQAIGNSYANPNLPPAKAFAPWQRQIKDGPERTVTFADHSYLANKALWDEFFFSSITPQRSAIKVFGTSSDQTAQETAESFFFDNTPLPNRRMQPYLGDLDESGLSEMFTQADQIKNGLTDQIAAHLIVEGAFNINSTSVKAWEVLLKSLKGKSVTYLDKHESTNGVTELGSKPTNGTPAGFGLVANTAELVGSNPSSSDVDAWTGWRELSDTEVEELAEAIVRQVKRRGPFLSLSEFINRRLDSSDPALATKGALQAALDDEAVSINAAFRQSKRSIKSTEIPGIAFREALEGPAAYGSAAYVDQADLLRNLAEQLTPRGDTFVIRTYGDSLDEQGNVQARAWCEAVVQRLPDYGDPADAPETRQADLESVSNQRFGRKMEIISHRWLSPDEV